MEKQKSERARFRFQNLEVRLIYSYYTYSCFFISNWASVLLKLFIVNAGLYGCLYNAHSSVDLKALFFIKFSFLITRTVDLFDDFATSVTFLIPRPILQRIFFLLNFSVSNAVVKEVEHFF